MSIKNIIIYESVYCAAVDGKVVRAAVMSIKNIIIYESVYRAAVVEFGLCDQVRVDEGKKFYLMLYIQELLGKPRES